MKVGILTFHFSENYGALLQAYCLRQWLLKRGVNAEFINYHPRYVEEGGNFEKPWRLKLWKKNLTVLYLKLENLRRKIFQDTEFKKKFTDFQQDSLGVHGPKFQNAKQLSEVVKTFDLLICGSDQIWNPSIQYGLDPTYFLDIPGSENIRKISYAASFGRSSIEENHLPAIKTLVEKLDGLSVREKSGIDILASARVDPSKAVLVPDPTILLGSFDDLLSQQPHSYEKTVFCYALRTDKLIRQVAECTRLHTGYNLVSSRNANQRWADIGEGRDLGPKEWLSVLSRSKIIVSNSFHGVALSIVFNIPFISVGLPGAKSTMNARVSNLLRLSGLENRVVTEFSKEIVEEVLSKPIDWDDVNSKLSKERIIAESYLDLHLHLTSLKDQKGP